MVVADLQVWKPRLTGKPKPTRRTANRYAVKLKQSVQSGLGKVITEEWIDGVQGVVLQRHVSKFEKGKMIEISKFSCRKVKFGPLPKGIFKTP